MLGDSPKCVCDDVALERQLPRERDVREVGAAAGRLAGPRAPVRTRLVDGDQFGPRDAFGAPHNPRAHALAGNHAAQEHHRPVWSLAAGEHLPARNGPLDQQGDRRVFCHAGPSGARAPGPLISGVILHVRTGTVTLKSHRRRRRAP
jgi:hypothetical protein